MVVEKERELDGVERMRDWDGDADVGLIKTEQEWMATDAGWMKCCDECCSGVWWFEKKN